MIINEFEELTVPKVICPPMSVLAFLNSGNKDIHGGHHGAKKSMNTPELLLLQQKITIITNNLSQLNLQIFSPENIWEVFSCQCFHRVSLVGQPGGYCLIFFPFLRKCQRRKKHTLQMWRPLEVQAFHSGPAKNRYNRPEQSRKQKLGRTTNLTSIPPPTLNIAKVGNLRQKFKLFLHHPLLPLDDFFLR